MSTSQEKHFSIDAGIGKKMEGCPYSLFEDGHDVQEYIIPPKGYDFVGFKLEPLHNNQIYDGRLVAQYKKLPIKERLTTLVRGLIWTLGILAVIGIIIALTVSVFKTPKPTKKEKPAQKNEQPVLADTLKTEPDTASMVIAEEETETVSDIPIETEVVENQTYDTNTHFVQTFWKLIHQRNLAMDPYDSLYKLNKNQVSGEEYDYLRFTVLKDSKSFKHWTNKLRKIPNNELESIETIEALKNKLKEIN